MSIHALSWVLEHSEAKLGARLTLIVLADHAKSDGTCAWPAVETIARQARMSRRAVQDALRKLEADGSIAARGKSKSGTTIYDVMMGARNLRGGADNDAAGAQNSSQGGEAASPEPSGTVNGNRQASSKSPSREHPEFSEWIGHHHFLTGDPVLKAGTQGRAHIASMFAARRDEGLTLEELKLASEGAFADEWRRANGHFGHESVLRPTKVQELVAKGRRVEKAKGEQRTDWTAFDE